MHRLALSRAGARSVRLGAGVRRRRSARRPCHRRRRRYRRRDLRRAGAARRAHRSGARQAGIAAPRGRPAGGLPVLGICRGSQMINVALGGTLHTDIHEVYVQAPKMRTVLPKKTVSIVIGSRPRPHPATAIPCRVNALHHQSVDRLGRGLAVVARDESGIVQAIEGEASLPGRRAMAPGAARLETPAAAALRGACQGGARIAPRFRRTRPPCRKRSALSSS